MHADSGYIQEHRGQSDEMVFHVGRRLKKIHTRAKNQKGMASY